jgi:hypothetical protein
MIIDMGTYHNDLHGLYRTQAVGDWVAARGAVVDSDPFSQAQQLSRSTNFTCSTIGAQQGSWEAQCD